MLEQLGTGGCRARSIQHGLRLGCCHLEQRLSMKISIRQIAAGDDARGSGKCWQKKAGDDNRSLSFRELRRALKTFQSYRNNGTGPGALSSRAMRITAASFSQMDPGNACTISHESGMDELDIRREIQRLFEAAPPAGQPRQFNLCAYRRADHADANRAMAVPTVASLAEAARSSAEWHHRMTVNGQAISPACSTCRHQPWPTRDGRPQPIGLQLICAAAERQPQMPRWLLTDYSGTDARATHGGQLRT